MYTKQGLRDNTEFGYFDGPGLDPGVGGAPNSLPDVPFKLRGVGDYSRTPLPDNTEFGFYDGPALDPGGADELPDPPYLRGLGGSQSTGAIISSAGSIGGAVAGALLAGTAAAGPVGAAIAGVGILLTAIFGGRNGAEKVASTKIVNQVEPLLQQNLAAYFNGPRTATDQAAALQNFDYAWAGVMQQCSNPQLGSAGQHCTADRQEGACVIKDAGGECWDWFKGYRDPIANDTPNPDPVDAALSGVESLFSGGASSLGSGVPSWVPLALIAGAVAYGVFAE